VRGSVVLVALLACGKHEAPPETPADKPAVKAAPAPPPETTAVQAEPGCTALPFAESTPVPEASAAAWMTLDSVLYLVVVADSGHDGAFGVVDPDTGKTTWTGTLPLGTGATDDIEGLAAHGDRLVGLTSAGMVRVWRYKNRAFELVEGPYAIGTGSAMCDPMKTNCGPDYEGLALAPGAVPAGSCAGFACSRADGGLHCLTEDSKLHVDPTRTIAVESRRMALADCAFSETGVLYAGNNLFGLSKVRRIDGWQDPATAKIVELGALGTGFPEVIAVRGDVVYRMSDVGGDVPSLMAKFRCAGDTR
jgi:hypothetical protein